MRQIVLSHFQVEALLAARRAGRRSASVSLDLELTTADVTLEDNGVRFPDGQPLAWQDLETIRASERGCFLIEKSMPRKIQFFSEQTNQLYSLMPTERAPTMLISGIPMHRVKNTDPHADTLEKIKTIAPLAGCVLDTATGLGYTAIEAAKSAERVVTIELDPAALQVARLNPWSQSLFDNPKIIQTIGDSFEKVQEFKDNTFARIIHDPPMFTLAGDLYSGEFYRQLFRVLKPGGRLFHYIGDLESKSGRVVSKGAARRLQEAGFARVRPCPAAFGLVACKP
jgi:predicted methyltransferase